MAVARHQNESVEQYHDEPVSRIVNGGSTIYGVASVHGECGSSGKKSLTVREKAQKWNEENLKIVIRDNLYPLAKIIFDSEEELQYDGDICKVIMAHVKFDEDYTRLSKGQQEMHRKAMWSIWSTMVSKGLDSKRHNQKAAMRRVFWGKPTAE